MKKKPEIWKLGDHDEMASDNKKCRQMDQNLLKSLLITSRNHERKLKIEPVERKKE